MKKIKFLVIVKRRIHFMIIVIGLMMSMTAWAQLPTAQQLTSKMTVGWNLGNTLEVTWGAAGTASQRLIDSVKAAGINSVRLPCAWNQHSNAITNIIDPAYLALVK